MAQVGNKNIDNASGQVVRLDMQNTVQAVATNNFGQRASGGTILPCEFFADDTSNKLLIRSSSGGDQADPASSSAATFFEIGDLDTDNLGLLPLTGGAMTGPLLVDGGSGASAPAIAFVGDTATGIFRVGISDLGVAVGGNQAFKVNPFGAHLVGDGAGNSRALHFLDGNNSNHLTFAAPSNVTSNINFTLPGSIVSGGFLQVDASGNLSFQTISTSAGGLTGNSLSSNIVSSSLTSVGTLVSLIVSGNSEFQGDIHAGGNINGDTATNIQNMNNINCVNLGVSSNISLAGGLFGQNLTAKEPLFLTGLGGAAGKLVRAFVKFNGTTISGTSLAGVSTNYNVGSITDHGVGDYQVNYVAGAMTDSNGNATNEHSVCIQTNNQVYPVSGQLAHTHPMLQASDVNHVRFICAKDENSAMRIDNPIVMVHTVL